MQKKLNKYKNLFLAKLKTAKTIVSKFKTLAVLKSKKVLKFIQVKPFTSFFAVLLIFLVLMIVGNVLFSPKKEPEKTSETVKKVNVFKLGSAPEAIYQGKVEKSGVIKIVAQMPGIVSGINVFEGQQIYKGTNILSLSSNYSGGNTLSYAREIAALQYNNTKNSYPTQKELITKQRQLADINKTNSDKIREITNQTVIDTQALVDLDKTIVDSMSANIAYLESTNVGGANDTAILQSKQQLLQFQSALSQTQSAYKNLLVQTSSDTQTVPSISYEVAMKGLEIQEKALDMGMEISRISYNMALVNEANMYPSSPVNGTVNKIFVRLGDSINPGMVLANISGNDQHAEIVVNVPANIAKNISNFEPSTLYIGKKVIKMLPTFVSKDATNGVLFSVIYQLDDSLAAGLTDATYINVSIPIGVADTTNIAPFIPLDSILQTQSEAYVFIIENGKAKSQKITLGEIQGKFVEVLSGLPKNSQVIIDRNVIEGDKVEVLN